MTEKRKRSEDDAPEGQSANLKDDASGKLDPEAQGIRSDAIETTNEPSADEEKIVADPDGARRYGNTPAA